MFNREYPDRDTRAVAFFGKKLKSPMSTVAMKSSEPKARMCPSCRTGHLQVGQRERAFHPHGQTLVIPLLTSVCEHCGAEVTSPTQYDENLRRLAARKDQYGSRLIGEEIIALRLRFGLTQQVASRIFGKSNSTFSRYESETTYPDKSTTHLISMAIAKPETLKWLADQADIEIPLWGDRSEDEQRVPTVHIHDLKQYAPASLENPTP